MNDDNLSQNVEAEKQQNARVELLPCPHCGAKPKWVRPRGNGAEIVHFPHCFYYTDDGQDWELGRDYIHEEKVKAWNQRAHS